jgi:hypothetical protein
VVGRIKDIILVCVYVCVGGLGGGVGGWGGGDLQSLLHLLDDRAALKEGCHLSFVPQQRCTCPLLTPTPDPVQLLQERSKNSGNAGRI